MKKDIETREDIKNLVDTFYTAVRKDNLLGSIFNDIAQVDWQEHLPKMYDFWETALFHLAKYKGNPLQVHALLHQKTTLRKEHFDRWLALFKQTIDERFKGQKAYLAKTRANSIAVVIRAKLNTIK